MSLANRAVAKRYGWWWRFVAWLRRLLTGRLALPSASPKPWPATVEALPEDLRTEVGGLRVNGVVRTTVSAAIEDYIALRSVIVGPGASANAVADAELLGNAEDTLRAIIDRAPAVDSLVSVARRRRSDRKARAATGDAILALRDRARHLHDTASAAICWASTGHEQDRERLEACAERLVDR